MSKHLRVAAVALSSCLAFSAQAGTIPYPDVGSVAPANSFVAEGDGAVTAYFYDTSAAYTSRIGLWINGVSTGLYGLTNKTSSYGDSFFLGNANAGDELVFELQVQNTNSSWYSLAFLNPDGNNHTYATDFGGDGLIPLGTYVSFEDVPGLGDKDYNDHQFVFTNIRNASVPEPLSLILFGLGAAALGFARRRAA
jgi:hypothetical protein